MKKVLDEAFQLPPGVFDKIMEAFDTPASRWLRDLPRKPCPVCKVETIFFDPMCTDCEEKGIKREGA